MRSFIRHWRLLALLGVIAGQYGCASLPPALSYANMVLSSISYVSTSKGPSDLAISYTIKKDCSLMRAIFFKPICKPITEDTNKSLIARARDYFGKHDAVDQSEMPPEIHTNMSLALNDMINSSVNQDLALNMTGGL